MSDSDPTQPPSVEAVRRTARHRLLGASVLAVAAVLAFPMLFESQPRPVPANFDIQIPSRHPAPTAVLPSPASENREPAVAVAHDRRVDGLDESEEVVGKSTPPSVPVPEPVPVVQPPAVVSAPSKIGILPKPAMPPAPLLVAEKVKPQSKPEPVAVVAKPAEKKSPEPKVVDKVPPKPVEKEKPKLVDKPVVKLPEKTPVKTPEPVLVTKSAPAKPTHDDSARALALLEGRPASVDKTVATATKDKPAEKTGKHVVQIGAFADPNLAQEARSKLERAGIAAYTQVGNTPDGQRTRVRVGPFATRAEADKAVAKVRALGLSAAILAN